MIRFFIIIVSFVCGINANAQKLPELKMIDISRILPNGELTGFIGDDIQNMRIKFLLFNQINEKECEVSGKSKVKNNICDFKGILEIENILEVDIENGDEVSNKVDGKITGRYKFKENAGQQGTGIFEGMFEIYWSYDSNNNIEASDIWYTNPDCNIIFQGFWTSYRTGVKKTASWSDYKCCFPEGFNVSDGPDLIPAEQYRSKGWSYLIDLYSDNENKRLKAEKEFEREWWK